MAVLCSFLLFFKRSLFCTSLYLQVNHGGVVVVVVVVVKEVVVVVNVVIVVDVGFFLNLI